MLELSGCVDKNCEKIDSEKDVRVLFLFLGAGGAEGVIGVLFGWRKKGFCWLRVTKMGFFVQIYSF